MSNFTKLMQQAAAGVGGGDFYPYTIDNSARFNDDDSAYMSRVPSSAGNRKTFTISFWVKRGNLGIFLPVIFSAVEVAAAGEFYCAFDSSEFLRLYSGYYGYGVYSLNKFRDTSSWYHIVYKVDTTQATAADRLQLYVNGQNLSSTVYTQPAQNTDLAWNNSVGHRIGYIYSFGGPYLFDGYLAEFINIDGQALDPTSFGENKNGVWIPKEYTGSFGTNGFYLDFSNSAALGTDVSGNGNNFTSSGLTSSDQMIDTPTNNFATLNPLLVTASAANTYANGNLEATTGTTGGGNVTSTMAVPFSGKWYFEFTPINIGSSGTNLGLWEPDASEDFAYQVTPSIAYLSNANKRVNNVTTSYGATWTNSDVMGVAVDIDGGTVTFYKNNSSQGAITFDASGLFPFFCDNTSGSGCTGSINFGQLGFTYTPPADHLALCTANLPEPTIGPNSATTSDENFNTVLYTGTGSARTVTGVGFQPDWLWIKKRSAAENHALYDVLRGPTKRLESNNTNVEDAETGGVSSFDSDGFSISGASDRSNTSGATYVAWNWKANGSGVTNTDGSITSTVSANTNAGISIVTYTGSGSTGQETIGVGLNWSGKNKVVITKNRDDATFNWGVNSNILASNKVLTLNTTNDDSQENSSHYITYETNGFRTYNGGSQILNLLGDSYIAYCFAEVEGFSKFGSYTGNGSADGPFIYTGFRPAWIMFKCATQAFNNWYIHDAKRNTYNLADRRLYPNDAGPEGSGGGYGVDINSNGYKIRNTDSGWNGSGQTYIYMAFAENPFKYANAR